MRRACVACLALALVVATLVGCGRLAYEVREPWRRQAEEACAVSGRVAPSAALVQIAEIDGPGACGITYPLRVSALAGGTVGLTSRLTLACPIIPEIDAWLARVVQPAAALHLGVAVSDIRGGSYACRPRNNQGGAKTSEHAFGNALDVMGFRLADGREVSVKTGWRGRPEEQDFLREVFIGACRHFTTVLGPGSDMFHYDHFHLDLARHDPAGRRRICRPVIKFEPRIGPGGAAAPSRPAARPEREPGPPLDLDEDDDAYASASSAARPAARGPGPIRPGPVATVPPGRAPVPSDRAVRPTASAGEPLRIQPHLPVGSGLY